MDLTAAIASLAVVITLLGLLFTSWRYSESRLTSVREEADAKIVSLRNEAVSLTDKVAAVQDKARHDLANSVNTNSMRVEADVERLKRETVRREELTAIETRMTAGQTKIEAKLDAVLDRIGEVRPHVQLLSDRVDALSKRSA